MARELSAVLDHIAKIGELDLDGRAADLARRRGHGRAAARRAARVAAARGRARPGARRQRRGLPRPQPAGMSETDILELSAAAARRAIGAGALSASGAVRGLSRACGRRRGATAELLHVGRRAAPGEDARAPLGGVPLAVKDLFCTEGVPSQSGSRILEGYEPPYTATVVSRLGGRRAAAGEDQPGRVRDGLLERELGVRPGAQPVGPRARARGAPRAGAPPRSRPGSRRGRSAPTPAARSASRRRCAGSSG